MNPKMKSCPFCGAKPFLRKYKQTNIPPPKNRNKNDPVYICQNYPKCFSHAGCVKGTTEPIGNLANSKTRKYRRKAHRVFDELWKTLEMSREEAYTLMSQLMDLPDKKAHISQFDIYLCKKLINKVNEYNQREITPEEQWHLFLTRGIWKETSSRKAAPLKLEVPKLEVDLVEIPNKIRYTGRILTLERQEENFLFYKYYIKVKIHGKVAKFYQTHISNLMKMIKKGQVCVLKE